MLIDAKASKLLSKKGMPKAIYESSYSQLQRELFKAQGLEIILCDDNHRNNFV